MKRQNRNYRKRRRRFSPIVSFIFHLKRNHLWLRRFAFLWIFLIALEIACPILECRNLVDFSPNTATVTSDFFEPNSSESISQNTNDEQTVASIGQPASDYCRDECLCHVTGIPGLVFDFPSVYSKYTLSLATFKGEPTLANSPPFEPPKTA